LDDNFSALPANSGQYLFELLRGPGRLALLVTRVDMDDRGASVVTLERRLRYLIWLLGSVRVHLFGHHGSVQSSRDDDFPTGSFMMAP
jgi:hypothetical protein